MRNCEVVIPVDSWAESTVSYLLSSLTGAAEVEHIYGITRKECHVGRALQSIGDVLCSFDFSHRNETWTEVTDGIGDQFGSFCLTFSSQNGSLGLLFALEDNEFSSLGILLCNLLLLNRLCKVM